MDENYMTYGRAWRGVPEITNLHYYRVEFFYFVVDMQLQELNDRFTEVNTELLLCLACLYPDQSFSAFDKDMLIRFAKPYPYEFSLNNLVRLDNQLETYIIDMWGSAKFAGLKGIGGLAEKLVETRRNIVYPLVYLVKLALIFPIATPTVERAVLGMKIVKDRLRTQMGDSWMNDCSITYIEPDVFNNVGNELIIQRFQIMKSRRGQL